MIPSSADGSTSSPDREAPLQDAMYQQLGVITRQLHAALSSLGVMSSLQVSAEELPDARSRLRFIAEKTGQAAEKVLGSVDQAKEANEVSVDRAARLLRQLDISGSVPEEELRGCLNEIAAAAQGVGGHLTDIMVAQDFHDLTGQVVKKVIALAGDLEDSLLKLLIQSVPPDQRERLAATTLQGPVVDLDGRADVVGNQSEVDDLLASLGF